MNEAIDSAAAYDDVVDDRLTSGAEGDEATAGGTLSSSNNRQTCASCGKESNNLKTCSACQLVNYCNVNCQYSHWTDHKVECSKAKRAAELRDGILFKQPESSHFGDCPLCCFPLPLDHSKSVLTSCCRKQICNGCCYAITKREPEAKLHPKCPFCRKAAAKTEEEINERCWKRIEANDSVAICDMGTKYYDEGDYKSAFDYWTRAIALGNIMEAHYQLSTLYHDGKGVEKDEKRELHHLTEAAIGGYPRARYFLGYLEEENGRVNRAVKHYIIAAKLGHDDSLAVLKERYKTGFVSKEDFAAALRGHKAAIDATKSPQRKEAEKALRGLG